MAHTTHIQPSSPPYPSPCAPVSTPTMPGGNRKTRTSIGQTIAAARTRSLSGSRGSPGWGRDPWPRGIAAGNPRRGEVPVAEEHRVGDHAEERRAHHEPSDREARGPACERRRADEPD